MATGVFGSVVNAPRATLDGVDGLGRQMLFYLRVIASVPRTLKNYRKEIVRLLAEVTLGSGSLAVIGGTVGVITAMCFFTGTEVGLQGYAALHQLGTAAFSGFVSAYFNTREIARWSPASPWPRPSAAASPPSSAPCASPRRSTPWRSWPSRRCRSW